MNIHNKKFSISVSIANVNVSVLNVLSMVLLKLSLGKHKDHDVKTIRKAQPIIKGELQRYINKISTNTEELSIK